MPEDRDALFGRPVSVAALALIAWTACGLSHAADEALVLVKSEPPGASVFLDDETAPRGETPCAILVAPGRHVVRALLRTAGGDAQGSSEVVAATGKAATVLIVLAVPRKGPGGREAVLAEFDSLIDKGDYAGARKRMQHVAAREPAVAELAGACARVASALEGRAKAVRGALDASAGEEVELDTVNGKLAGKVADIGGIGDEGVVLTISKKLRGMGTIETRMKVKWGDLTPAQDDALARRGGWRAEGADGAVARAVVALSRKDAFAAKRALDTAGEHPLAVHYRGRLASLAKPTTPVIASKKSRWPPEIALMRRLFRGHVRQWDPKTLEIELLYDFQDPRQVQDWSLSDWVWQGRTGGTMVVREGVLKLSGVGRCALLRPGFTSVSASVDFDVNQRGKDLGQLLVCADGSGNFYSVNGTNGNGQAYIEKFVAGKYHHLSRLKRSPFAATNRGTMSLGFEGGHLTGRVGDLAFDANDRSHSSGRIGFRGHQEVAFDNLHVTGRLDRAWLEHALGVKATGPPAPAPGKREAHGLLGTYFMTEGFKEPAFRRIDARVDFVWGGPPAPGVPRDRFSVRWEGLVVPPATGRYVFHLDADDEARLSLGGTQIARAVHRDGVGSSRAVTLQRGRAYPIAVSLDERTGRARARLLWSVPGVPQPVPVPPEALRPPKDYERFPGPRIDPTSVEIALGLPASRGLLGTYFGDGRLGAPVMRRIDTHLDFGWGDRSPAHGIPNNGFSVRWEGSVVPPRTGDYTFHAATDDGSRLFVDGRKLFGEFGLGAGKRVAPPIRLEWGRSHAVRFEYREGSGTAGAHLLWAGPGMPTPVPVPTEALRPPKGYEKLPGPPWGHRPPGAAP